MLKKQNNVRPIAADVYDGLRGQDVYWQSLI